MIDTLIDTLKESKAAGFKEGYRQAQLDIVKHIVTVCETMEAQRPGDDNVKMVNSVLLKLGQHIMDFDLTSQR